MSLRRKEPPSRIDWSENAPRPEHRGLPQEWYTRILGLCVVCSVISAVGVIINGSLGNSVVETEEQVTMNSKRIDAAATAVPRAKREASKVARVEATKVAKRTRRVVLREARTVFRRQIVREVGRQGAVGRPPTIAEVRTAVAELCALIPCFPPITVEVALLALTRCIDQGGCGQLRGPPGADGAKGEDGRDAVVSDERLDERFALYCAMIGGCKGSKGDKGDPAVLVPCAQLDPALGYACVAPPLTLPPDPPPTETTPEVPPA